MDMACSTRLLPLVLALSFAACSDDGVPANDENTTAGSTSGVGTASDTSPGGSSGGDGDTASGSDTDSNETTGDPTGPVTSGTSTSGGSTGGSGDVCVARCMEDDDCLNNGMDIGQTCSDNGFCHAACEEAADCIPLCSGWVTQPCSTNDACLLGPCVDYGGETGGCAIEPTKGADCESQMLVEVEATDIEGNMVTVCGETGAMCTQDPLGDMSCIVGCETFGCTDPLTCEADGYCHCTSNDDCVTAGSGDTCSDEGFCFFGCEGVEECEAAFGQPLDGQTLSCE